MIKVCVVGNVTADLAIKEVKGDKKVCTFTVASNRIGDEKADYINVEVWNKIAENCAKYLSKGSSVTVAGDLKIENYEKDGVSKTFVTVINAEVQFTDRKKISSNSKDEKE